MGGLTKEELLDVKNIKLLKEIKRAFDNQAELERLGRYVAKSREFVHLCQIERSEVFKGQRWYSTALLVDLIEMMKKGELVLRSGNKFKYLNRS